MANQIRLLGAATDLTAATDVNKARVVRVFNNTAAVATLTQKEGATVTGSVVLAAGEVVYVHKHPTETLEGAATLLVTPVGFDH